jgi:hypothetical protein
MKEELKQPFFVQFLESQKAEGNSAGITKPSADLNQTQKYPSDGDEGEPSIFTVD